MLTGRRMMRLALAALSALTLPQQAGATKTRRVLNASLVQPSHCHAPTFSPDGERLAMICDYSGLPQVWIVGARGGRPVHAIKTTSAVTGVYWSSSQDIIAFSEAPQGGLNEQTYIARPDGSHLERVTKDDKADNWLSGWTADGRKLMIESNLAGTGGMDDYVVDPHAPQFAKASSNSGTGDYVDVSRDERYALLRRVVQRGNDELYLVDLHSKHETALTDHLGLAEFFGHLTDDGSTVYSRSDQNSDRSVFIRIRVSPGGHPRAAETLATRPDADLQSAVPDHRNTRVALFWNKDGKSELWFYLTRTGKLVRGPTLPTEIADADELSFSPDGSRLALTLSGSISPSNVWILDLRSFVFTQISKSRGGAQYAGPLVRPSLITYTASDGIQLSGWLYRPSGSHGPVPLVISIHGGPETEELPSFRQDYQDLLREGIGVFAPNIRGSDGFGKTFKNLDNGPLRVNAIRDVRDTVMYLIGRDIADPKHIGIMGGSYGGYMTLAALAEYPTLFAAGADLYGIANFQTFFAHTEPWMASVSKLEYGDPATQSQMLWDLSPINKIGRIRSPLLVLHGDHDTNVPVGEAEQVVAGLQRTGTPVKLVVFEDEGHGWTKASTRVRSNLEITRWFGRYLQDRPHAG